MKTTCPVCGKAFWVDWPNLWVFKRGKPAKFICSYGCGQKYDRDMKKKGKEKGMARMRNSTKEMARGLLDAMDAGKDPMEWLKEKGYTNPEKAYQNIKERIKDRDPELAKRFPQQRPGKKKATVEVADKLPEKEWTPAEEVYREEEPKVELVYDESIAEEYRREQAQKAANERIRAEDINKALAEDLKLKPGGNYRLSVEETPETKKYMWRTAAVRNEFLGVFYYDAKHNTVDWRHPMGEEISMPPADWNLLAQSLAEIMYTLGVDRQELVE